MPKSSKPNIILITVDSLRADFVGYQNPREKNTPFLDKLADRSCVCSQAIAPSIPTPFFFPSLMMGRLPFEKGYYLGIPEVEGIQTLAEALKSNGYLTLAFIADNAYLSSSFGYHRGFDFYFDRLAEVRLVDRPRSVLFDFWFRFQGRELRGFRAKLGKWIADRLFTVFCFLRAFYHTFIRSPQIALPGEVLNARLEKFFKGRMKEPFFVWVHYMDVHIPYFSGVERYFRYHRNPLINKLAQFIFYVGISLNMHRREITNPLILRVVKEAYRSSIKYTDQVLADLYDFLKDKYPDSVIIITSDHGEGFMEHGLYAHAPCSLYNELIRVPLLINFPYGEGRVIERPVSLLSLAKTICAISGIEDPNFAGEDILREDGSADLERISRILFNCFRLGVFDNRTAVRGFSELWSYYGDRYKYIVEKGGSLRWLYDLKNDPGEQCNLINDPCHLSAAAEVIRKLDLYWCER
jgi:arylsulfatase A-like enzyme